jgi:hypothetical protein
MGTLIGVSVGAGVFFVCLVILMVIGIKKFVLKKEDNERRKARKEKKERKENKERKKAKGKEKSMISTEPSS